MLNLKKITYSIITCGFIFIASTLNVQAQTPVFEWAKQFGLGKGLSVLVGDSDKIFLSGSFEGLVDFDPGPASFYLNSPTSESIFICKLTKKGEFIWAKQISTPPLPGISKMITIDKKQQVYITGSFIKTVDFDPGLGVFNMTAPIEIIQQQPHDIVNAFVCKLNSDGDFVWAKQFGTHAYGFDITVDSYGNIYSIGRFDRAGDFNPGIDTFNLPTQKWDGTYLQKLDSAGNFIWAMLLGYKNPSTDGYSLKLDRHDNLYVGGVFTDTSSFGFQSNISTLITNGGPDIFITKIAPNGNLIWLKKIGGQYDDLSYSIALDSNDNIYTTGVFRGVVDFDAGPGKFNLSAPVNGLKAYPNGFITKYNANGDFIWAKEMDGTVFPRSIALDDSANVYTTGYFTGWPDFDPSANQFLLKSDGNLFDIFVSKLNSNGNFLWAIKQGGSSGDYSYSIDIDRNRNIYTVGEFYDTIDMDPGPGVYNLSTPLYYYSSPYISKLNQTGGLTLSIKKNTIPQSLYDIYPNPNQGVFCITTKDQQKVQIYNSLGDIIFEEHIQEGTTKINAHNLIGGIYLLKLTNNKEEQTVRKLIIQ